MLEVMFKPKHTNKLKLTVVFIANDFLFVQSVDMWKQRSVPLSVPESVEVRVSEWRAEGVSTLCIFLSSLSVH